MAQQPKSLEYHFDTRVTALACDASALNSSTRHDFTGITVAMPEATGTRTPKAVMLHVGARWASDSSSVGFAKVRYGLKAGAGSFTDTDVSASGSDGLNFLASKAQSQRWSFDITAWWLANFGSGATQTITVGVAFVTSSAGNVNGVMASLEIVYEADDSNTVAARTVRIPLDGNVAAFATSLTEIGTNQIPALDTLLAGYSSKTYRCIGIEAEGNTDQDGNASFNLEYSIDGGAGVARATIPASCVDAPWRDFWDLTGTLDTSAAHAFKVKSTASSRFTSCRFVLVVTFSYDVPTAGSGTSFVSRRIPFVLSPVLLPLSSDNYGKVLVEFDVPEASPTLKQSGICVDWTTSFCGGVQLFCGSQGTPRSYTGLAGHGNNGHRSFSHRIDSGAAAGSGGHTLVRGRNTLTISVRESSILHSTGFTGYLLLNYTCTTPAAAVGGDFAVSRTCRWPQFTAATALGEVNGDLAALSGSAAKLPVLPTVYALGSKIGYEVDFWLRPVFERKPTDLRISTTSGETPASSWEHLGALSLEADDFGFSQAVARFVTDRFTRWRDDPRGGLDPEAGTRNFRISKTENGYARFRVLMVVDFHSQSFTVADTFNTDLGDGSGVPIGIHRDDTGELVATTTTGVGGGFSATVYDPSVQYYAQGLQDDDHMGRSRVGYPT